MKRPWFKEHGISWAQVQDVEKEWCECSGVFGVEFNALSSDSCWREPAAIFRLIVHLESLQSLSIFTENRGEPLPIEGVECLEELFDEFRLVYRLFREEKRKQCLQMIGNHLSETCYQWPRGEKATHGGYRSQGIEHFSLLPLV